MATQYILNIDLGRSYQPQSFIVRGNRQSPGIIPTHGLHNLAFIEQWWRLREGWRWRASLRQIWHLKVGRFGTQRLLVDDAVHPVDGWAVCVRRLYSGALPTKRRFSSPQLSQGTIGRHAHKQERSRECCFTRWTRTEMSCPVLMQHGGTSWRNLSHVWRLAVDALHGWKWAIVMSVLHVGATRAFHLFIFYLFIPSFIASSFF